MSVPGKLIVRHDGDNVVGIFLGNRATDPLFAYMVERMPAVAPDYAQEFEYSNWGVFSIAGAPPSSFMAVYNLIMQACEELAVLKPHQADLRQALESDPRFKQLQAA